MKADKIKVNRKQFIEVLKVCQSFLPSKAIIPIQEYLLLTVIDNVCHIRANALSMQIDAMIPVESKSNFSVCVKGDIVISTLSELDDDHIVIKSSKAENGAYSVQIETDKRKRYKLGTEDPEAYPCMRAGDLIGEFEINAGEFSTAATKIADIVNSNDLRDELRGISMRTNNGTITMYGGIHCSVARMSVPLISESVSQLSFIFPKKPISMLSSVKCEGIAKVSLYKNLSKIEIGGVTITSVLIDAQIPAFDKLFIKHPDNFIVVRDDFERAIKRVRHYCDETRMINMEIVSTGSGKSIIVYGDNKQYNNEAYEEIPLSSSTIESFNTCIDYKYLLDSLTLLPGTNIRFIIKDFKDRVFIEPEDQSPEFVQEWLIMPMKPNNSNAEHTK